MSQLTPVPVTFSRDGQRLALVLVGATFFVVGLVTFGTGISGIVMGVVGLVGGSVMAYRGVRVGVRADAHGITHRTLERTRIMPWCQIREVSVGAARGSSSPLPASTPVLTLKDASVHVLIGMARTATERGAAAAKADSDQLHGLLTKHRVHCPDCERR